jgi:UDP-GlcNAc:undecaprenyl-phosphate/decaprenyl-phosphate GlcNAc-1-phosphate transferase
MALWLWPLAAFILSSLALHWLLGAGRARMAMDLPNERSLHSRAVPRSGGLAIMAGTLVPLAFLELAPGLPLLVAMGSLVAISLADDFRDLPAWPRLVVHIAVACAVPFCLLPHWVGWVSAVGCIVATAWMTNLFNFMDGSDGLAGGMAVSGFATLAAAAAIGGAAELAVFCICIVAAALAFLRENRYPARIFMGDSGSIPLGFAAAALGAYGMVAELWHWWLPTLAFSVFIVDASMTLTRRALKGEKLWRAHRTHYYQRMVQMGQGHGRTARLYYLLMATTGGSALLAKAWLPESGPVLVALWLVAYGVLGLLIDRQWARFSKSMELPGSH